MNATKILVLTLALSRNFFKMDMKALPQICQNLTKFTYIIEVKLWNIRLSLLTYEYIPIDILTSACTNPNARYKTILEETTSETTFTYFVWLLACGRYGRNWSIICYRVHPTNNWCSRIPYYLVYCNVVLFTSQVFNWSY